MTWSRGKALSPQALEHEWLHPRPVCPVLADYPDQDSLFTYSFAEDTGTFTDLAFPAHAVSIADFPEDEVDNAYVVCRAVDEGTARDGCVLDVLETGSDQFVDAALQATSAPVSAMPGVLDDTASQQVSVDFDSSIPINLVPARTGYDETMGVFAGPFKSDGAYAFSVPVRRADSA